MFIVSSDTPGTAVTKVGPGAEEWGRHTSEVRSRACLPPSSAHGQHYELDGKGLARLSVAWR